MIVYQSEFVRSWWQDAYGFARAKSRVIYNGVDLAEYSPLGVSNRPVNIWRLLMVEGSLMGGYEQGLQVAVEFAEKLAAAANMRSSPGRVNGCW